MAESKYSWTYGTRTTIPRLRTARSPRQFPAVSPARTGHQHRSGRAGADRPIAHGQAATQPRPGCRASERRDRGSLQRVPRPAARELVGDLGDRAAPTDTDERGGPSGHAPAGPGAPTRTAVPDRGRRLGGAVPVPGPLQLSLRLCRAGSGRRSVTSCVDLHDNRASTDPGPAPPGCPSSGSRSEPARRRRQRRPTATTGSGCPRSSGQGRTRGWHD